MVNDLKVGDLCLFWNGDMKFPFLSKLKSFYEMEDITVYYSEYPFIQFKESVCSGDYIETNEFFYCKKVDLELPMQFK